ncbi:hypothetical protein [Micromonospora sp. U21]|uniref:hypothetical protein n=1 Tax=Micromonospora sp. U21 TaxID=2824899 RepID=UPI001B35DE53|nr:hypothetical protein [Micromonospora sp. U21]MBQ0900505.1 hypothetical protein [Micromonospora sp. U21]
MSGPASLRAEPDPTRIPERRRRLELPTWFLVATALALIGLKPLFDIPGEKTAHDTVDLGFVASTAGAVLMVAAFVLVVAMTRRLPGKVTPALVALLTLGLLSVVSLLAVPAREAFIDQFAVTGLRDIFGPYVPPARGTLTQAAQLAVGFAPITLIAVMYAKPEWFTMDRIRWVLQLVLLGAVAHSVIAWLQVAGVVDYTFFFKLPGGNIGRASGGYFHPASLGRLLIFAVFILYVAGDRLRLKPVFRFGLLALMVGTTVVTTHRLTILCVGILVAAMELRRLPALLRWIRRLPLRLTAPAVLLLVVGLVVLLIRWGPFLWARARFLVTQIGSLNPDSKDFMRGRGEIWVELSQAWRDAPLDVWLFGLGYEPWNTHSDPIRVFVVWGVLGLACMAVICTVLWRTTGELLTFEGQWALVVLYFTAAVFAVTQKPTSYSYFMWLFLFSHILVVAVYPRAALTSGAVRNGDHP